jgi:plastocyanin
MKKLLVLLIACLALTIAACGDDDDDDGGGTAQTTEQTDGGATDKGAAGPDDGAAGGGGSETVDIPDISFDPEELTVKAGTTVTWTNSDDLPHTVTKDGGPGADFDSGNLSPGDEFEQTFDAAGKVDYVCTIHPGQAGSITVE